MNYTCAKCDPTEPHPDVDFCPKCDKQSARIAELEGALRYTLDSYDNMTSLEFRNGADKPVRDHARRVLGGGK